MTEIIKGYRRTGEQNLFAVEIKQGGDTYPIYVKSLTSKIFLDDILESGYQLTSLPLGFTKDGVRVLESLPVEVWDPTADEEQELLDLQGEEYDVSELKEKLTLNEASCMAMPEGKYHIFDREGLLKYLNDTQLIQADTDFLPLNYFVHPNALFTMEEYFDPANSVIVGLIEKRRTLTIPKFKMLIAFLKEHGLQEGYKPIDVCDAYFQWGIDGIRTGYISKKRDMRTTPLTVAQIGLSDEHEYQAKRTTIGAVTTDGKIHVGAHDEGVVWKTVIPMPEVRSTLTTIAADDSLAVELQANTIEETTVLEALDGTIEYTESILCINGTWRTSLAVVSSDVTGAMINSMYWSGDKDELLQDNSKLRALAQHVIRKNTDTTNVSSYRNLLESGCSEAAALRYFIHHYSGIKTDIDSPFAVSNSVTKTENEKLNITVLDIDTFLKGDKIDDPTSDETPKEDLLRQFIDGEISIGWTGKGEEQDMHYSIMDVYNSLYVAHHVLRIPIEEIQERVQASITADRIIFEGNGMKHTMDIPKIDNKVRGRDLDLAEYARVQVNTAYHHLYITQVARELGTENIPRDHVGVAGFALRLTSKAVVNAVEEIEENFKELVNENMVDSREAKAYLINSRRFAIESIFRGAMTGVIKYPEKLKTPDMQVNRSKFFEYLVPFIESTASLADKMVNLGGAFNLNIVNAVITPRRVYPKKNVTIKEYDFRAIWYPFALREPAVYQQGVAGGYIPEGKSWQERYLFEAYISTDIYNDPASLEYYNANAEQELQDNAGNPNFEKPTHIIDLMYPALQGANEEGAMGYVSTSSNKRWLMQKSTELSNKTGGAIPMFDYEERDEVRGFVPFQGWTHEDFYMRPDLYYKSIPMPTKMIIVWSNRQFTTEDKACSYEEIATLGEGYSVFNIYGRTYIVRDSKGLIWRCEI